MRRHAIIDCDAHVIEPNDLWARVPEHLRARAPSVAPMQPLRWDRPEHQALLARVALMRQWMGSESRAAAPAAPSTVRELTFDGEPVWDRIDDELWRRGSAQLLDHHGQAALAGFDAPSLSSAMRGHGVDRVYLFPTAGLWVLAIDGMAPELAAALSRAYNDWLRDYCAHAPELLHPVGAVSLHDPAAAALEVERLAALGWTSVTVRPNPIGGRVLGDVAHEPLFEACARFGVGIAIHEGTHARLPASGRDRFSTRFARHACSHPMEQMMAFLSLYESGTLERHPQLRVAFMESGCSWLPYWLWRLDEVEYGNLAWEVRDRVTMRPSEYFRRQCWIACEASEPMLEQVADLIGADRLLYGSDYPHIDHDGAVGDDVRTITERLGRAVARRIFDDNPRRFHGQSRRDSTTSPSVLSVAQDDPMYPRERKYPCS